MLIIVIVCFVEQYKVLRVWKDCQLIHGQDREIMSETMDNLLEYHRYIHNYRDTYCILVSYFGALANIVLQFIGIVDENDHMIIIPCITDIDEQSAVYRNAHSIDCKSYFFEDFNIQ